MDTLFRAGLVVGWVGFWVYLLLASGTGFILWLIGITMMLCVLIPNLGRMVIDIWRAWS